MVLRSIESAGDLRGAYVLVRGSLNVPLHEGRVRDTFRLKRALPTLEFLRAAGAKVILVGHLGRELTDSLEPVAEALRTFLPVTWGGRIDDPAFAAARAAMGEGDVLLAENLRQHPGETANDPAFAAALAALADVYVDDAFDNIHRAHASMVGVPVLVPSYAGLNVLREVTELDRAMRPTHPSIFLLGGAKFETKLPLVELYLERYDHVFIGGALANDLFRAQGLPVGKSLLSDVAFDPTFLAHPRLLLPVDVVVDGPGGRRVCRPAEVGTDEAILDAGPATVTMLAPHLAAAQTVLWNGPFGNFEGGFAESTQAVAKLVAASNAHSVLGGGDTLAAIEGLDLEAQFSFCSTGGGAMLTYLERGATPALQALAVT